MTFYDDSLLNSNDFPFHLLPFPLRHAETIELHHHQFVECVWISGGWGQHLYQGQLSPIQKGDVFVIEPGEEHGYRVDGEVLEGYNVLFQPTLLRAEFEMLSHVSSFIDFFYIEPFLRQNHHFVKHLQLIRHEQLEMGFLLDHLEREAREQREGYRILIKTYLIQLFLFLSRCYQDRQYQPLASITDDREVFMRVSEFIVLHHALPLTLDQVSQMCAVSPSTFKTKFKQYLGKTFLEFRNEVRLQTAQGMLSETDKKILTIAYEVGFTDLSSFNKAFKLMYGIPPSEYRKPKEKEHHRIENMQSHA